MILLILVSIFSFAWSSPPVHWSSLLEIRERHEFYQDNEVILKPKDAWQTLFAVVYPDRGLRLYKDCVYYKVPGESKGVFKIKGVDLKESCDKHQEDMGDTEVINLKALQFSFGSELVIHFTFEDFRQLKWAIPVMNRFQRKTPGPFSSSAHLKAPKLFMLAPLRPGAAKKVVEEMKRGELCHSISDDCQELSAPTCEQCPEGWFEVPNGCKNGPKYCGSQTCGQRNQPACRRGMKWQKVTKKFECRSDTSFAYCAKGLSVQCEGSRAYCR